MAKTPKTPTPTPAAEAAPATETATQTVVKVSQNGVTRPKDGTTTGRVWAIADEISGKKGEPADRKTVIEQVVAEGINASTGATQYGKWRKFFGLVGADAPGNKAPSTPAAPTAPSAPAAPATTEAPVVPEVPVAPTAASEVSE